MANIKILEKDIPNIILLHKNGMSPRKIAPLYNVRHTTIYKLLKKKKKYINRYKNAFIRKYHCNNNYFGDIKTEHQAYWLGLIAADGCIKKNGNRLSITLHNNDSNILSLFLKDLQSNYPIHYSKRDKCCRISIESKQIVNDLSTYNITPQKTFIYRFPTKLNKKLYNHFIRGYFDGDGCAYISKIKQIEYSITSNENFLNDIQNILMIECKLNKTNLKKYKRTKIKTMVYYGNRQTKRIYDYMYKNATIYFPRKKEKFDTIYCALKQRLIQQLLLYK